MDALIFDIDGTLWDSRHVVAQSWNQVVEEELGYNPGFTGPSVGYLFGRTMTEIADLLFPDLPPQERQRMGRICFEAENRALEQTSGDFYPTVLETLPKLRERCPLFILSNCQKGYIDLVLRHSGLQSLFTDWMCFDDTGLSKGENMKLLVERNHLTAPVYVGDTQGDWEACRFAGVPMIFAAYGLGQVEEPLPTIHRFDELLTLTGQ